MDDRRADGGLGRIGKDFSMPASREQDDRGVPCTFPAWFK